MEGFELAWLQQFLHFLETTFSSCNLCSSSIGRKPWLTSGRCHFPHLCKKGLTWLLEGLRDLSMWIPHRESHPPQSFYKFSPAHHRVYKSFKDGRILLAGPIQVLALTRKEKDNFFLSSPITNSPNACEATMRIVRSYWGFMPATWMPTQFRLLFLQQNQPCCCFKEVYFLQIQELLCPQAVRSPYPQSI